MQKTMFSILVLLQMFALTCASCALDEFGFGKFTEYRKGSLGSRIIITAPHGGYLRPKGMPVRVNGCYDENSKSCVWEYNCGIQSSKCRVATLADVNTRGLAIELRNGLYNLTGMYPHLVINHLHRRHMDPNRGRQEGTLGDTKAGKGWYDFHRFVEQARSIIKDKGILFDIHGQVHKENWIELGYLLSGSELDSGNFARSLTSIANIGKDFNFNELLRGISSLGGYLQQNYKVVPSPKYPGPNGGGYFNGGYSTRYYGSRYGGHIDAIQIESPSSLMKSYSYPGYAQNLAKAINSYFNEYYVTSPMFGLKKYTEYIPGSPESKIILTSPHGGYLLPDSIPDRVPGCNDLVNKQCIWKHGCGFYSTQCKILLGQDSMTQELARNLREEIYLLTGSYPHLIVNNLHRKKLDANRPIGEAALGNDEAEEAWNDFQDFVRQAKESVKTGILFDIHGVKTHPEKWIELGYGIYGSRLDSGSIVTNETSISNLAERFDINELLHGFRSFGDYVAREGYKTVPSPDYPSPKGGKYYSGGYITRTHGSKGGHGAIDAIQIESPLHLRQNESVLDYSKKLANAITQFVNSHY